MNYRNLFLWLCSAISLPAFSQHKVEMKQSESFDSKSRHEIGAPIPLGDEGILQVNNHGLESFQFQLFSNDLKMKNEKTVETEDRIGDRCSSPRMVKIGGHIYLFMRQVYREQKQEGVSCLRFNLNDLDFAPKSEELFRSSEQVAYNGIFSMGNAGFEDENKISFGSYKLDFSRNQKAVVFTYRLKPERKKDVENHDVMGMQVFNQNMEKRWGGEMRMPFSEARMDNLSFIVSDQEKVYLLCKVYDGETSRENRSRFVPNYHLELLIYEKGKETPTILEIKLDRVVPKSAYLFETEKGEILLGGFYAKALNKPTDGAFVLQLNEKEKQSSLKNGGLFEIPSELIKSFASKREMRQLERKEDKDSENDLGVDNLLIRNIYVGDEGTLTLLAEQYRVVENRVYRTSNGISTVQTTYDTYADDIYIIQATPDGKSLARKIPKSQHSNDYTGAELSFNSLMKNGVLYVFFTDNKKNLELEKDEAPKTHQQGKGGYLCCVSMNREGVIQRQILGEISDFETNFFIRRFVDGDQNNLIYTARRHRRNTLISIGVAD